MDAVQVKVTGTVLAYFNDKGLTQADIAKKVGVSQASVSSTLKSTGFGTTTARKWHQAFGFSIPFLLTGNGTLFESEPQPSEVESDDSSLLDLVRRQQETISNLSETVLELAKKLSKVSL